MALPTIQLMLTLLVAHLFVFLVLFVCWWFIRHAQGKHHEQMAHHRARNMPKALHPEVKDQVLKREKPDSISLPTRSESSSQFRLNKQPNKDKDLLFTEEKTISNNSSKLQATFQSNAPASVKSQVKAQTKEKSQLSSSSEVSSKTAPKLYQDSWNEIEDELKVLRGSASIEFTHKSPSLPNKSKVERISADQTSIDATLGSMKSHKQEEFENHVNWVKSAIKRKGYRDPGLVSYERQLDSIDEVLATLKDNSPESDSAGSKSVSESHSDWRDKLSEEFENLFAKLNRKPKQRKSLFGKKLNNLHLSDHKDEIEARAIDLVQNIAKRIEGNHPIPASELDWIEASLEDVHREIWKQKI